MSGFATGLGQLNSNENKQLSSEKTHVDSLRRDPPIANYGTGKNAPILSSFL
jgi:hypothetical protein